MLRRRLIPALRTAPAFMAFAFCMGCLFLFSDSYHMSVQYDRLSLHGIILYLLIVHFSKLPYSDVYSKLRWMLVIFWAFSCVGFNLFLNFPPAHNISELVEKWGTPEMPKASAFQHGLIAGWTWVLYKPVFFGILFWKTYVLERRYTIPSDTIEPGRIYICLWRPHTARTLAQSLLGIAVGSVCLYADGRLYGFQWGKPGYGFRNIPARIIERKFIAIDTGYPLTRQIRRELRGLIGTSAGFGRCKCVWVIRRILNLIDPELKPHWHHYAPARYGIRAIKWRKSHGFG